MAETDLSSPLPTLRLMTGMNEVQNNYCPPCHCCHNDGDAHCQHPPAQDRRLAGRSISQPGDETSYGTETSPFTGSAPEPIPTAARTRVKIKTPPRLVDPPILRHKTSPTQTSLRDLLRQQESLRKASSDEALRQTYERQSWTYLAGGYVTLDGVE